MDSEPPAFDFLPVPPRPGKPRSAGLTEIRGPYSSVLGPRALEDLLELAGGHVDSLKFPGGSFVLMPRDVLRRMIDLAHAHDVEVSTGGFLEWVLMADPALLAPFLDEARELGFDAVEISSGYLSISASDLTWLVGQVSARGLVPKPEISVWAGAGSGLGADRLSHTTGLNLARAFEIGRGCLEAGAPLLMVESEGLTEDVEEWRTQPIAELVAGFGLERLMFEAADFDVSAWYISTWGPEVNLFVDHSQILAVEAQRRGLWGANELVGRVIAPLDRRAGSGGD